MKQALLWSTVILLCAASVQTAAPDVSSTPTIHDGQSAPASRRLSRWIYLSSGLGVKT
jgi:hypothetical protein